MALSDLEKISCLRLMMTDGIGPVTYRQLLDFYGTATKAIESLPELAVKGGRKKPLSVVASQKAEEQLELAEKENARILFRQEDEYPKALKQLSDSAPILYVKGQISIFNKKAVAMVGTRNASLNGKALGRKIAFDLAEAGYNVVSGLAHGIDRAAHVGALASEKTPATTAVLGGAVNEVYPLENQDIYDEIAERGCLVSEFPFGSVISPRNFPRRNRIISGLSLGTVVIEANERSGSLITAHEAANQGREVFAVPGSPVDPRSSGPNALIRDGANLVTSAQDIIDVLEDNRFRLKENRQETPFQPIPVSEEVLTDARSVVLSALGADMVSVDTLIAETGLDARIINIILMELTVAGRLERHTGNRVSLIYQVE